MPYSEPHLLFRHLGSFGSTSAAANERWSYSLRIRLPGGGLTEAKKIAFLAAIKTASLAFHASTDVKAHSSAWLDEWTAAYIGLDGHYVGGDTQPTTRLVNDVPTRGAGSTGYPFSHAMVVTLQTDIDRGRGHQGRFYVPSAMPVEVGCTFPVLFAGAAADAAKTYIDAVNTAARVQWDPQSAVSVFSKLGAGVHAVVMRVGVGQQPDTQRRRDNDIPENHQFRDLGTTLTRRAELNQREWD